MRDSVPRLALIPFLLAAPLSSAAQGRGETPPSFGRENTILELRQGKVLNAGRDAAGIGRQQQIRILEGIDGRRQQRNAYASQRTGRLLQDQTERQAIRDARAFNPAQRRLERRRDRVDRRLRARINRAIKDGN